MKERKNSPDTAELRRRAEDRLKALPKPSLSETPQSDTQHLIHELQVQQIELEIQKEELLQSRARLEAAVSQYTDFHDFAPVGYFTLARDGTIRRANLAGARLLGVERDRLMGRRFAIFISDGDRPTWHGFIEKVLENRAPETCEVSLHKEGHAPLWAHIAATVSEDGQECRTVVVDITERRQAQETLLALSLRQQSLLSAIPDIIMEVDANKVYTWANGPGIDFYGEDVIGREAAYYFEGEQNTYAEVKSLFDGDENVIYLESWQRDKRGDKRLLAWWCRVVKDQHGNVTGALSSAHDITERKRAEEALRQSEEQYRILVENASEAIFVAQDGKLRFVNGRSQEITGYTREELTSRAFIEFVHPDDRELLMDRHIKQQQDVDLPSSHAFRILHATGEMRWMELSAVRIEWAGRPATLNFMSDITERKRAENEREKLQAQFLQAQKMESVGRLAGGVAHDFNNMLGIILGYAEMAMDQVDPAERLHDNLLEIRKAAQRSAELVRQLLAFARKHTISPRALDLNDTVTDMIKILQRLIGEGIELVWKPGLNLWSVTMDPSQLDQVLANLSVNARDAIDGVGSLTIETENAIFDESYCQTSVGLVPGEYVLLALSDSGAGMDAAVLEHLFEPFFTTKEVGKGTGLGLATVYGIVKQNNGVINVYSEPGMGTTVKIYLPRAQAAAAATPEAAPAMPVGGTETVLLVEDE